MIRLFFVRLLVVFKSCWFVSVEIGGVSMNMFVDIGLLVFFLLKEIYEILSFRLILIEVVDMLIIVDGEFLCVYGKFIFLFWINEIYFDYLIVIVDLGGFFGILGLDFLFDNEIVVDICKGILMFLKFKI